MEIKNFIGIYEKVFSQEFCQSVINYYQQAFDAGFVMTRQQSDPSSLKIHKDDTSIYMHQEDCISLSGTKIIAKQFKEAFSTVLYPKYLNEYDILKTNAVMNTNHIKVQKTNIGGGYHIWHNETDTKDTSNRVLAWTVYLNDVEDGGETEFLYQHLRIKPTQGTFVIWPAGFTHTHRGNPPLSGDKYIMTGWLEY
jgi:hypothetical protein